MKIKTLSFCFVIVETAVLTQAQTTYTGALGLTDLNGATISPGGNIGTVTGASTFTIGDLFSLIDGTGVFAGLPHQDFGTVSFTPDSVSSLAFSNPSFGAFLSTSFTLTTDSSREISYYVLGNYNSGSFDGGIISQPASFFVTFDQDTVGGPITDSATFSIPPATVPEPGSLAMLGLGVSAVYLQLRRCKS